MIQVSDVSVKGHRCVDIDFSKQDIRLKLQWLLYNALDDDVRAALAAYGKVVSVTRERWRVHGVVDKAPKTRWVTVQLNQGSRLTTYRISFESPATALCLWFSDGHPCACGFTALDT